MRTIGMAMRIAAVILLAAVGLAGESWNLPRGTAVKDRGPRTYRFIVDYTSADTRGRVIHRQRLAAEYTRGLPGGDAVWNKVTSIESAGAAELSGSAEKRDFMEGFRYHKSSATLTDTMKPDFFKGFPPAAVLERNLVWDEEAMEMFGQDQFEHLKLNQPYRVLSAQEVDMPGVGKFQNRDVQLVWTGRSERNGQDCAVIEYRAYFNPLEIANGSMNLKGRSHYWGQIWVSLATKQIEYATIYEDVLGEMKWPGQDPPQVINVFRSGVFEPVAQK
jgi:hypothetical protein